MSEPSDNSRLVLPPPPLSDIKDVLPLHTQSGCKTQGDGLEEKQAQDIVQLQTGLEDLDNFVSNYAEQCKSSISQFVDTIRLRHEEDHGALKTHLQDILARLTAAEMKIRDLTGETSTLPKLDATNVISAAVQEPQALVTPHVANLGSTDGKDRPMAALFPDSVEPPGYSKNYRPSRRLLNLHITSTWVGLHKVISKIKDRQISGNDMLKTMAPHEPNYGCFKAFNDSAYLVTNYAAQDRARLNELLKIEAQIDKAQHALDNNIINATRVTAHDAATIESDPDVKVACLVDLGMRSQEPAEEDLAKVFDVHTFSLSVSLGDGKKVEELSHEEALHILSALPLNISYCTERTKDEDTLVSPPPAEEELSTGDDTTELELLDAKIAAALSQRNSLAEKKGSYSLIVSKDPDTGAWSLNDLPRAPKLVDEAVQTEPSSTAVSENGKISARHVDAPDDKTPRVSIKGELASLVTPPLTDDDSSDTKSTAEGVEPANEKSTKEAGRQQRAQRRRLISTPPPTDASIAGPSSATNGESGDKNQSSQQTMAAEQQAKKRKRSEGEDERPESGPAPRRSARNRAKKTTPKVPASSATHEEPKQKRSYKKRKL